MHCLHGERRCGARPGAPGGPGAGPVRTARTLVSRARHHPEGERGGAAATQRGCPAVRGRSSARGCHEGRSLASAAAHRGARRMAGRGLGAPRRTPPVGAGAACVFRAGPGCLPAGHRRHSRLRCPRPAVHGGAARPPALVPSMTRDADAPREGSMVRVVTGRHSPRCRLCIGIPSRGVSGGQFRSRTRRRLVSADRSSTLANQLFPCVRVVLLVDAVRSASQAVSGRCPPRCLGHHPGTEPEPPARAARTSAALPQGTAEPYSIPWGEP